MVAGDDFPDARSLLKAVIKAEETAQTKDHEHNESSRPDPSPSHHTHTPETQPSAPSGQEHSNKSTYLLKDEHTVSISYKQMIFNYFPIELYNNWHMWAESWSGGTFVLVT